MKSLNTKLVLSALGLALLATPAFAQRSRRQVSHPAAQVQVPANDEVGYSRMGTYPNPQERSGSEWSRETGAEFGLGY